MNGDSTLQNVIDGLRARLQAEIETQLGTIAAQHDAELARARDDAEQAAEQRWAARLESTRSEWSARLASEVDHARADAERRLVAEAMRVRMEAEQSAAEAAAAARDDLEQRLADERRQADERVAAARAALQAQLEADREQADAQLALERARAGEAEAEARAAIEAERQRGAAQMAAAPIADRGRLAEALATIDGADSLSDVLALTAAAAALEAPRAALFIVNGPQLEEWHVPAVPALSAGVVRTRGPEAGVLGVALTSGSVAQAGEGAATAPTFAGLAAGRGAVAVPLMLGEEVVGALYGDDGANGGAPAGWRDSLEILGRHASARLAYLTAVRTAQAVRLMRGEGSGSSGDPQAARRYAKLLVSEIKLYNEAAVQAGREKRDLLRRLKPEIDRARALYDERVPAGTPGRDACFEQELVQTLADGDAALLG
jgi:chemotaxis protein histidine kinase CheA